VDVVEHGRTREAVPVDDDADVDGSVDGGSSSSPGERCAGDDDEGTACSEARPWWDPSAWGLTNGRMHGHVDGHIDSRGEHDSGGHFGGGFGGDVFGGGDFGGGDSAGGDSAGGDSAGGDSAGGDSAGGDSAGGGGHWHVLLRGAARTSREVPLYRVAGAARAAEGTRVSMRSADGAQAAAVPCGSRVAPPFYVRRLTASA
jgi:hypothetical protein